MAKSNGPAHCPWCMQRDDADDFAHQWTLLATALPSSSSGMTSSGPSTTPPQNLMHLFSEVATLNETVGALKETVGTLMETVATLKETVAQMASQINLLEGQRSSWQ